MKRILALAALAIAGCAGPYAFEKQHFSAGNICPELVGTWFTDVTVENRHHGAKRDITKLERRADGTVFITGVSVYFSDRKLRRWSFSSEWSCDGEWYVELNEYGYTAFKILTMGSGVNRMLDERNNMSAPKPITLIERRKLDGVALLKAKAPEVAAHLGL